MTQLQEIKGFLDELLQAAQYDDVVPYFALGRSHLNGVETLRIERLGLALHPTGRLYPWARENAVDALWLHRPWGVEVSSLPEIPVLAYHLAFDESLTLGYNPYLADALRLTDLQEFGYKEGRPIGMIGQVAAASFLEMQEQVQGIFGGTERARPVERQVKRVAVVGAMNKRLVREATEEGCALYLTGQWREHAEQAVAACDMGVITVGHERSEVWGLRLLARLLAAQFPSLETLILEP